MKSPVRIILLVVAIALLLGGGFFFLHIREPRIIGRAVSADGTEMCIVQQCNWSIEMFTTSFVYRKPGGPWGWFYFNHQDDYWNNSPATVDEKAGVAVFYRNGSPAVTFAWPTETYTLHPGDRTMTGAQWTKPQGWSPRMSVYAQ